jgi:hypothetical protein
VLCYGPISLYIDYLVSSIEHQTALVPSNNPSYLRCLPVLTTNGRTRINEGTPSHLYCVYINTLERAVTCILPQVSFVLWSQISALRRVSLELLLFATPLVVTSPRASSHSSPPRDSRENNATPTIHSTWDITI